MIISHKFRFIFFKTYKTAGTSLEAYLSDHCGPEDILTPFGAPEASHRPRNHQGFFNHIPAFAAREKIDRAIWNDYLKFCVVRNPWDKAISHYYMIRNSPKHQLPGYPDLTIDQYLASGVTCHNPPIYTDPATGEILADVVLRYESLTADLGAVFGKLGVPFAGSLNYRAKGGFRSDRRDYREALTRAQAERIAEIYRAEIELHGYEFDNSAQHARAGDAVV